MEDGRSFSQDDRSKLIEDHQSLVVSVLGQVSSRLPRHVEREELIRAGMLGLVEAAGRFDPERGVSFPAFAAQRIRGAMLDQMRAVDWAPRSLRAKAREMDATEQHLASSLGRSPDPAELAEALGVTAEYLATIQKRLYRSVVLTLEQTVYDVSDDTVTLGETLADASADQASDLEARELHGYLRDAVNLLPEKHRLVIIGYFLENRSSDDLARFLGVTESRISQLRSEGVELLKEALDAQYAGPIEEPSEGIRVRRRARYASAVASASDWRSRLDRGDSSAALDSGMSPAVT
jgi:RNA polymerase sigma factor for flagellar operon FliA